MDELEWVIKNSKGRKAVGIDRMLVEIGMNTKCFLLILLNKKYLSGFISHHFILTVISILMKKMTENVQTI
mgnify:CR=1 FL=1